MKINKIIQSLNLQPHPEGGYYKETYRSKGHVDSDSLPQNIDGDRNYSTSIYYLLCSNDFSVFHRIKQDEVWHFYKGSSITIHMLTKTGAYKKQVVGNNISKEEQPQFVVEAGDWFAVTVNESDTYSLLGCTVSPGFDFADFELANKEEMLDQYPNYKGVINKLCKIIL